jgi:UDP-glucose 4-epimerase
VDRLIAITGAGGFIGRALCAHLAGAGRAHRGVVRARTPEAPHHSPLIEVGDLATADVRHLTEAFADAFAVVHLAGRAHGDDETIDTPLRDSNIVATERVVAAAVRAGVQRFILASSVKVFGDASPPGQPFHSSDPPAPTDAYARSKVDAERLLLVSRSGSTMVPVVLRLPLVYGPGVRANFLRLIDAVARRAPLPLGSIHNRRDLLYVGNLVHAIVALVDEADAPSGIWLVADGEPVSTPELVRRLAAALDVGTRLFPVPVPLLALVGALTGRSTTVARLTQSLEVDASPLRRRIGPMPWTLEQGLAATALWWRAKHSI